MVLVWGLTQTLSSLLSWASEVGCEMTGTPPHSLLLGSPATESLGINKKKKKTIQAPLKST
jgi:hypothetical protein